MEDVKNIRTKAYPGMLVFARIVKNLNYDYDTGEERYEYEDKLKAGFIKERSNYFEGYYNVCFTSPHRNILSPK